jgi:hypothetical protein
MTGKIGQDIQRSGNRLIRKAQIAFRAEGLIARRRLAVLRTQTALMAFAGLVAGIGLIMLNVAAFLSLRESVGATDAAFYVAGTNFLLAVILGLIAVRLSAEEELAPVIAVRDLAVEEMQEDIGDALVEVQGVAENLRRMARDPLGAIAPNLVGTVLSILAKSTNK